ncbi:Shikimate kinase protein [Thalictrum thalictroides]|uniref:shikimate kinase n=1 Tax=Thalictrum thalictroides TaxID=46969 RepID=A0A7J6WTR5_THATH|nr:Shikimate kinase protein [Thalictrum thalictroides]
MEVATCASSLHYCSWNSIDKVGFGSKVNGFLSFSQRCNEGQTIVVLNSKDLRWRGLKTKTNFELSCAYKNSPSIETRNAPTVESETNNTSVDGALVLRRKAQDVGPDLSGRCIYLVGMMGSGKTTVGKILSEVLGYSFFDSDKLVEQAVGATSVAQIFKQHSEKFFRDNESKVLGELATMRRLVVATGGGAVIRPINWKYMKQGITVWLDVPLEALARRIAAVGTGSRPLLHEGSGDAYTQALKRLSHLSEERGEVYANADARVCLEHIACKLGLGDVADLTPSAIAIEALLQIEKFLKEEEDDDTVAWKF